MIVAIRHGKVWNPQGLVYARLPGFRLGDAGRMEVEELARSLARAPVVAVGSSPLERAVETATILARPHGLPVGVDERLVEWSFWVRWQGMPWSAIRGRDPELLEAYARDPAGACPEDPLADAGGRILRWAGEAEDAHPEGLVLGVTHEAPLVAALLLGQGRSLGEFHSVNIPHLGAVRLRPGPAEPVDLVAWALTC